MGYQDSNCACGRQKDYRANRCGICARRSSPKSGDTLVEPAQIERAIRENNTLLKAANQLGVSRQLVTRYVETNNVDISHLRYGRGRPYSDEELFCVGERRYHGTLKKRLREQRPYVCVKCRQNDTWNGESLTLELDHIDGDTMNNRKDNLRFLCPNCHSQTPTSKGRNMKAKRKVDRS